MSDQRVEFSVSSICLIRLHDGKTVPALILDEGHDGVLVALQLRTATEPTPRNTVFIGQPAGLRTSSAVMLNRPIFSNRNQVVKVIAQLDSETASEVQKQHRMRALHQELRELKRKVLIATLNNVDCTEDEKRIDEILETLGYLADTKRRERNEFMGFREAPSKDGIKVYLGGR